MLAILTTHPIQYQVPLWQALARDGRVPFEVWYLTSHATKKSHDVEFGKEFSWDLDMLAGYPHRFLDVTPGATPNSFWKCRLKEKLRDRLRKSGVRALWIQGWQVVAYWQAVREAKAAGVEVWLRGESNDLAPTPRWKLADQASIVRPTVQASGSLSLHRLSEQTAVPEVRRSRSKTFSRAIRGRRRALSAPSRSAQGSQVSDQKSVEHSRRCICGFVLR